MADNLLSPEVLNKIKEGDIVDFDLSLIKTDASGKNILYYALLYDNGQLIKDILKYGGNDINVFNESNLGLLSSVSDHKVNGMFIEKIADIINTDVADVISNKEEFYDWYAGMMYFGHMDLASSLLSLYISNNKCSLKFVYNCFEKNLKLKKFDFNDDLFNLPLNYNNPVKSILVIAAEYKEWDIVEKLITVNGLDSNVGLEVKDNRVYAAPSNKLPLLLALEEKNFKIVKFMINNGACVNVGLSNDRNAVWRKFLSVDCNDIPDDVFELFMESGLELRKTFEYGKNILSDLVCRKGFTGWFKKVVNSSSCTIDFFEDKVLSNVIAKNRIEEFDFLFDKLNKLPVETFSTILEINSSPILGAIASNCINPVYYLEKLNPYIKSKAIFLGADKYEMIDVATFYKNKILFSELLPLVSDSEIKKFKPFRHNPDNQAGLLIRVIREGFADGVEILKEEMLKRNMSLDLNVKAEKNGVSKTIPATQFFTSFMSWSNDIVKSFFDAKLNANQVDSSGNNALFFMVAHGWGGECINKINSLFENGADLNHLNNKGQNALFMVSIDAALIYLERGIDFRIIDNDGNNFLKHIFNSKSGSAKNRNVMLYDYVSDDKKFTDLLTLVKDILSKEVCADMINTLNRVEFLEEKSNNAIAIVEKVFLELNLGDVEKVKRSPKI